MSNSDPTMAASSPTGVGPLDALLGWGFYLLYALPLFFVSMYICVMVVIPQFSDGIGLAVFAVWFCITIYLLGKSK